MKGYARKNKRMQLNVKYARHGMARSNTRKLNKRQRFEIAEINEALIEMHGTTFKPKLTPQYHKDYRSG